MTKPRLFIIGAPKCGTTALCTYLADHPDVCFSRPKEAKFFHTDFSQAHRLCSTERQYLRNFAHQESSNEVLAEGTVWYLYSRVAVGKILAFQPEAQFVVMVRNPVELSCSLHAQLLYGGDEDVEDFLEAWRLQPERAKGEALPRFCREPRSLQYGEIASLGGQVQRLLRTVPRERVLFIVFDDFAQDPSCAYRRVLDFVGLPDDQRTNFPRINTRRSLRPGILPKIMFHATAIKRSLGIRRSLGIWQRVKPILEETKMPKGIDDSTRTELRSYFADDVALLSKLLERDLSHWLG